MKVKAATHISLTFGPPLEPGKTVTVSEPATPEDKALQRAEIESLAKRGLLEIIPDAPPPAPESPKKKGAA